MLFRSSIRTPHRQLLAGGGLVRRGARCVCACRGAGACGAPAGARSALLGVGCSARCWPGRPRWLRGAGAGLGAARAVAALAGAGRRRARHRLVRYYSALHWTLLISPPRSLAPALPLLPCCAWRCIAIAQGDKLRNAGYCWHGFSRSARPPSPSPAKEQLLAHGDTVYLRLAPVDPRSPMQTATTWPEFRHRRRHPRGTSPARHRAARAARAAIRRDARGEATLVRLHTGEALASGEQLLRFQTVPSRWGGVQAQVSTDAYFFQEGQGRGSRGRAYGEFRGGRTGRRCWWGCGGDLGALWEEGAVAVGMPLCAKRDRIGWSIRADSHCCVV
ncbi:GDYXXLXY domain-containing protein [Cupriavidus basilensis]